MRRVLALVLSFALVFSLSAPAFAVEASLSTGDVKVVETKESRSAVTSDGEYVYKAINNMRTGMFTLVIEDRSTSEVVREIEVNLNNVNERVYAEENRAVAAVVDERDTHAGYSYRIESDYPHDDWKINCPQDIHDSMQDRAVDTYYLYLPYSPANQDYLDDFRAAVKALDNSEEEVIETAGLALLLEFLTIAIANAVGGPLAASAAEVIIVSLTGLSEYQDALRAVNEDMTECYFTWRNAWRYGEDRHY